MTDEIRNLLDLVAEFLDRVTDWEGDDENEADELLHGVRVALGEVEA